jgi:hypothetical protein
MWAFSLNEVVTRFDAIICHEASPQQIISYALSNGESFLSPFTDSVVRKHLRKGCQAYVSYTLKNLV